MFWFLQQEHVVFKGWGDVQCWYEGGPRDWGMRCLSRDWTEECSAYSRGRQHMKYLQEHRENSSKAVPSLFCCPLRLPLLRPEVRGTARSSSWSCRAHQCVGVCCQWAGRTGGSAPLHAVREVLGGELRLITGVWMSSLLCSPALCSHRCAAPMTVSSQESKCSCTGGISGHLHELT